MCVCVYIAALVVVKSHGINIGAEFHQYRKSNNSKPVNYDSQNKKILKRTSFLCFFRRISVFSLIY